jgi:putative ABC transport system ATP-binding protein
MSSLIRFEHVSVSSAQKNLLTDISFTLQTGKKTLICGQSGAGKTTLIKTLLGLYPLQTGCIYYQDQPLSAKNILSIRRQSAYIGQEPILGAETVRAALLLPFSFKAYKHQLPSATRIDEVLQQLQLPTAILQQACQQISGGEKQRIALARAVLLNKTLYLLDEVTSALDKLSKQAVFDIFSDPALTVLSISHDPDWLDYCETSIEMTTGHITQIKQHGNT